jgi:predicted Na+-dependent transporter
VIYVQVMPLSGFFVSKLLKLPSHYAAGLILVACCPGGVYALPFLFSIDWLLALELRRKNVSAGTASNIVTYLAR